jgi:hypothetical protein
MVIKPLKRKSGVTLMISRSTSTHCSGSMPLLAVVVQVVVTNRCCECWTIQQQQQQQQQHTLFAAGVDLNHEAQWLGSYSIRATYSLVHCLGKLDRIDGFNHVQVWNRCKHSHLSHVAACHGMWWWISGYVQASCLHLLDCRCPMKCHRIAVGSCRTD